MKRIQLLTVSALIPLLLVLSCDKLDVKPKKSLVVPQTLADFQGMLDNDGVFNSNFCSLGEIGADNYYVTPTMYDGLNAPQHKKAYIWADNTFSDVTYEADWNESYERIFYCNVVLDGLEDLEGVSASEGEYNNIKGQALFHRAHAFFMLAQEFVRPFHPATAEKGLGIPLRVTSDINEKSVRGTMTQTYNQIIADLDQASNLLPNEAPYKTRPVKAAAYALLARVYLAMGNYQKALAHSESCLQLHSTLLDYNDLDSSASYPIPLLNDEVIFHGAFAVLILIPGRAIVDSTLYHSYSSSDLRKALFFRNNADNTQSFRGSYASSPVLQFAGIATDEVLLTRAECNARLGNTEKALNDLNTLLSHRFRPDSFTPVSANNAGEALAIILKERRKELLFRGLRWMDLRRLNSDPRFEVTLTRKLGSEIYSLPPTDPNYTYPIPDYVIALTGMEQNP